VIGNPGRSRPMDTSNWRQVRRVQSTANPQQHALRWDRQRDSAASPPLTVCRQRCRHGARTVIMALAFWLVRVVVRGRIEPPTFRFFRGSFAPETTNSESVHYSSSPAFLLVNWPVKPS
jgi:hypothetical protein